MMLFLIGTNTRAARHDRFSIIVVMTTPELVQIAPALIGAAATIAAALIQAAAAIIKDALEQHKEKMLSF